MRKQLAVLLCALASSSVTMAEVTKCKAVTSLPAELAESTVYCLKKNLVYEQNGTAITTGNAIAIYGENAVLDLNGFTLSGGDAPTNTNTIGIHIGGQNVTVRNGTVQNFSTGIYASSYKSGIVVENMRVDSSTYAGITLYAKESIIRNNFVLNTGGSTISANNPAYGICPRGSDIQITANQVVQVMSVGSGAAFGIGCDTVVDRNLVQGNVVASVSSPSGTAAGIYFYGGVNHMASDNRVIKSGAAGISFSGTGVYMNNLVDGATNDYTGSGVAAGSTNY